MRAMLDEISKIGQYLGDAAYLMIGQPSYQTYADHLREQHPDQSVMTYEEFFRERQQARYGGKGKIGRCC
jgi:uncharacterized short protein YbdD (DUF466 family)